MTRDGAPRTLAGSGVAEALRSVAAQAALPVVIDADGFGRYPPEIERAVYYSCVEALQNSVKHGGPSAVVRIGLRGSPSGVSFVVEDSGVGFEAAGSLGLGSRTWPIGSGSSAAVSPSNHMSARAPASAGRSRFEHGQR